MKQLLSKNFVIPVGAYVGVIATIIISKTAIGSEYALLLSAGLMLWVPFLLDHGTAEVLRFDPKKLLQNTWISLAVLFSYLVCMYLVAAYMGKTVRFIEPSALLVLTHLVAIAFPEEFFFRGYIQRELGGGWGAVIAASALFAAAHFLVICVFSSGNYCGQNTLTFFPSLVMGYLYMKTGTIWSSVFFHFAANIIYLSFKLT
ncbi:MAG: CPBP family intramembrane metalloprotease [Candidatus Dadabacteria bacterium]|nr:CPBP family intramembrane metalloprotease [Candidatus Dadabacteria bacterium]